MSTPRRKRVPVINAGVDAQDTFAKVRKHIKRYYPYDSVVHIQVRYNDDAHGYFRYDKETDVLECTG